MTTRTGMLAAGFCGMAASTEIMIPGTEPEHYCNAPREDSGVPLLEGPLNGERPRDRGDRARGDVGIEVVGCFITVRVLAWALLFKVMPATDRGTVTGLATTTKGIGLVIGPLVAGGAIDIFHDYFRSTNGYGVIWPVVAIPVLAVIPLVALLAEAESGVTDTVRRPAA